MNDIKNMLIAWGSASTSAITLVDAVTMKAFASVIMLPVVLFLIGKSIDVLLQFYFHRRDSDRRERQ